MLTCYFLQTDIVWLSWGLEAGGGCPGDWRLEERGRVRELVLETFLKVSWDKHLHYFLNE